jgi:uncharacterized protein YqjF (DUF2071 family)
MHANYHAVSELMYQSWNHISFLHWRCSAALLQDRLPAGLEVDTEGGSGWISITPFLLENLRTSWIPPLPWVSRFPETNLRTYVRGAAGPGIWFFSLDAARLPAVFAARATFGLPYYWAQMRVRVDDRSVRYQSTRGREAATAIQISIGEPFRSDALSQFLTERYRLYATYMDRLISVAVQHQPWPLRHARVLQLEQTLTSAAALQVQAQPDLIHYSNGVDVRFLQSDVVDARLLSKQRQ